MPRYEYVCNACGANLNLSSKIADRDGQSCKGDREGCQRPTDAGDEVVELVREEIPMPGAPATYNWSKWQR